MILDIFSIYEVFFMGFLDKKRLEIFGINNVFWFLGGSIIVFWVLEDKGILIRVILM